MPSFHTFVIYSLRRSLVSCTYGKILFDDEGELVDFDATVVEEALPASEFGKA